MVSDSLRCSVHQWRHHQIVDRRWRRRSESALLQVAIWIFCGIPSNFTFALNPTILRAYVQLTISASNNCQFPAYSPPRYASANCDPSAAVTRTRKHAGWLCRTPGQRIKPGEFPDCLPAMRGMSRWTSAWRASIPTSLAVQSPTWRACCGWCAMERA